MPHGGSTDSADTGSPAGGGGNDSGGGPSSLRGSLTSMLGLPGAASPSLRGSQSSMPAEGFPVSAAAAAAGGSPMLRQASSADQAAAMAAAAAASIPKPSSKLQQLGNKLKLRRCVGGIMRNSGCGYHPHYRPPWVP